MRNFRSETDTLQTVQNRTAECPYEHSAYAEWLVLSEIIVRIYGLAGFGGFYD